MTTKEIKKEVEQVIANAVIVEDLKFKKCPFMDNERWTEYRSEFDGRKYSWVNQTPEEFGAELVKRMKSQVRAKKEDLTSYNKAVHKRQETLVWLRSKPELWEKLIILYNKYKDFRKAYTLAKSRSLFVNRMDGYRDDYATMLKIEEESKNLLGRKDLFYLYDSFPMNWLQFVVKEEKTVLV